MSTDQNSEDSSSIATPPTHNREGGDSRDHPTNHQNTADTILSSPNTQNSDQTEKTNNSSSAAAAAGKKKKKKHQHHHNTSWASGSFSEIFGWDSPTPTSNDNKPPLPNKPRSIEAEFHDKNRRFLLQAEREKMRMNAPSVPFARSSSPSMASKSRKRLESIGEELGAEDAGADEETTPLRGNHHIRVNSDEVSALSNGSWYSRSSSVSQLSKQDLERIAAFEKQQQESFDRAKEKIGQNLSVALEQRALTEKDKASFIRDYIEELERERENLVAQWKAELAAERERLEPPIKPTIYETFFEPCFESIASFLATSEVFLANLPLTIGAVGLSWVTMGTVWFKYMEENVDFCFPVHFYSPECTFPEYPGCFECDRDKPLYQLAVKFHYACSFFAGCCCILFFLKVIIAWKVVADELKNPTTSTPMGVVCIATVCVFAGQGDIGEGIVLVTSCLHVMLAFWFLYMAIYKFGLWPDPGWFPSTVGLSYAAVKTWIYFPVPGLILLCFAVVFFFGIFFVSVVRVALNKKIAAPVAWIGLSAPSITLYGLSLVAQPTPYKQELLDSESVLQLRNHDWMIKHYLPFQHFMMFLSLIGLASAVHGLVTRWDGFRKKPFSPAHVAFCFPTLSHTNAVQAYRGAVNAFSSFPPGSPFKVALYVYWVIFLVIGTTLNLVFTYMYIRRLPQWTKLDTAGEDVPPDPENTFVYEMLDGTGAHELLDQPFMSPAVLQANEAGALVRVRRGTEDYRIYGPYVRTRKVTALGFDPTMDDDELRRERAELLDWVAKNAPRTRNRTMSNPLVLSALGRDGAPDAYGTFGGHRRAQHKRSVTSSGIPGV